MAMSLDDPIHDRVQQRLAGATEGRSGLAQHVDQAFVKRNALPPMWDCRDAPDEEVTVVIRRWEFQTLHRLS
jgi:cytochrome c5